MDIVTYPERKFGSTFFKQILRRKNIHLTAASLENSQFRRTLGLKSLISLGVGAVVGAGAFVITGRAAACYAGPALSISFALCIFPCLLTALCYGELAAMLPVAGSAYTHTSVALGEYASWVVAICLTLECLVSGSAVAVSWSASIQNFLREFSIIFPIIIGRSPIKVEGNSFALTGSIVDLPAILLTAFCSAVLCVGVQESATVNNFFVLVKLVVLIIFVLFGVYQALTNFTEFKANLTPFIPSNTGTFGEFGFSGILRGAGVVFFANVGFDTICAAAQECRNPQRDIPRGVIYTLLITSTLYIAVTIALTGMVNYKLLDVDAPVVMALQKVDAPLFLRILVDIGTMAGLSSVCFASFFAMPRLVMALSLDGLVPLFLSRLHPRYRIPINATLGCGIVGGLISGFFPLDMLGELISFGALVAFIFVCVSMWKVRVDYPEFDRPFVAPFFPIVPILGVVFNCIQLFSLPLSAWRNYLIVFALSSLWYVIYGLHKSAVENTQRVMRAENPEQIFNQVSFEDIRIGEACVAELPDERSTRRKS